MTQQVLCVAAMIIPVRAPKATVMPSRAPVLRRILLSPLLCAVLPMGLIGSPWAVAERLPVLQQIDLPHPYYFREMYLPQLTSGPSSLAWSPDSSELIYSMAGSLWRQKIGASTAATAAASAATGAAQQLTAGSYDYQPDWSPDGRWVIYSSYRNDAMELWVLDLGTGKQKPLLMNGAVNVEPRF